MNFVLLTNPMATSQSSSCFTSYTVHTAAFVMIGHFSLKHFLCLTSRIPCSPGFSSVSLAVHFLPPWLFHSHLPDFLMLDASGLHPWTSLSKLVSWDSIYSNVFKYHLNTVKIPSSISSLYLSCKLVYPAAHSAPPLG